jgi:hypothetical protein
MLFQRNTIIRKRVDERLCGKEPKGVIELGSKARSARVQEKARQDALLCCLWKARFPQRRQSVWDFVCLLLLKRNNQRQSHNNRQRCSPKGRGTYGGNALQINQFNCSTHPPSSQSKTNLSSVSEEICQFSVYNKISSMQIVGSPRGASAKLEHHPAHFAHNLAPPSCPMLAGTHAARVIKAEGQVSPFLVVFLRDCLDGVVL